MVWDGDSLDNGPDDDCQRISVVTDAIADKIRMAPLRSNFVRPSGTLNPVETIESAIRLRNCCGYLRLPKRAIALGAAASTRTLAGLIDFADAKSKQCWPALGTVANRCGLPRRTVMRHVQALEEMGLVCVDRTFGTSNYTMRDDAWPARSQWLPLPLWWNCTTWSTTAVYSWILARQCLSELKESEDYGCFDDLRLATYSQIRRELCLTKRSIRMALEDLSTTKVPIIGRSIPCAEDRLFEVYLCPTRVTPPIGKKWHHPRIKVAPGRGKSGTG